MIYTTKTIQDAINPTFGSEVSFWLHPESDEAAIVNRALEDGYVKQYSYTQVQWTEEGLKRAEKDLNIGVVFEHMHENLLKEERVLRNLRESVFQYNFQLDKLEVWEKKEYETVLIDMTIETRAERKRLCEVNKFLLEQKNKNIVAM